jgi:phosphoserine phosphatase RsbU/P
VANKSLSYILGFYISLAVLAVYLFFIVYTFRENKKLLSENIQTKAIETENSVITVINSKVAEIEGLTNEIVSKLPYYGIHNDIEKLIVPTFNNNQYLFSLQVYLEKNIFPITYKYIKLLKENDSIKIIRKDIRLPARCTNKSQKFDAVLQTRKPGWTEPYRCPEDSAVLSAFICPLYLISDAGKKEYIGWVACELSLRFLNQMIKGLKIDYNGSVVMVSKGGVYISHPDESKLFNNNLFNINRKVIRSDTTKIREILNYKETGTFFIYPEQFNYKKSIVFYTPVKETGWMLFLVFKQAELFHSLNAILVKMVAISFAGVLFVLLLIILITKNIVKPITKVVTEIDSFSREEPEYLESVKNEAEALNQSLERLKDRYNSITSLHKKFGQDNEKLNRDLIQASEIQKSFIKSQYPAFPERTDIDLHTVFQPAQIISGDLYDYYLLDRNNLLLAIGDVSGKGIPAALFMGVAHTLMRADFKLTEPDLIVSKINTDLCSANRHQFFLTLFLGILNLETGLLKFCNAGHNSSFILRNNGKVEELSESHGLPLGIYSDRHYNKGSVRIHKNDVIILCTDGITDTSDPDGSRFGTGRLKSSISLAFNLSSAEINKHILDNLNEFRRTSPIVDDVSLLTIKITA